MDLAEAISNTIKLYIAQDTTYMDYAWDAGPPILAVLAKAELSSIEDLVQAWTARFQNNNGVFALYGGAAGLCFGLNCVSSKSEALDRVYKRIRGSLIESIGKSNWSNPAKDWYDYDLITGPAGLLVTLLQDSTITEEQLDPIVNHLTQLLATNSMDGFRITECKDDVNRSWNYHSVNLGMAHGVVGVVAALSAYYRRFSVSRSVASVVTFEAAIDWIMNQSHKDTRGLTTWAPKWHEKKLNYLPASRREAWCYGAPSTVWVLWEAGNYLQRSDICTFAENLFKEYVAFFDPGFHLNGDVSDRLAICHGASGIMLIGDSFYHHANLNEGRILLEHMLTLIEDEWESVVKLAATNPSLLSGGIGILSAILTVRGGSRSWLSALALR